MTNKVDDKFKRHEEYSLEKTLQHLTNQRNKVIGRLRTIRSKKEQTNEQ